jgi:hypothetical protein
LLLYRRLSNEGRFLPALFTVLAAVCDFINFWAALISVFSLILINI